MIRYNLDSLGWYQFEALIQSLLKAELGLSIESWGGHSDRGRDAFAKGPLNFPDRKRSSPGPFIFQAKFVQHANSSGAKPSQAIIQAVRAEVIEIEHRRKAHSWEDPSSYVLLTNVPLHSSTRDAIYEILNASLKTTAILTLGANDICDMLDTHPKLRRAFPEIMSLRDLDTLLHETVNKVVLERSKTAIEETREVIPSFVPTRAYRKALRTLHKHAFVVLDGPPEMGKTAIARVISVAQLTLGWQAVDCRLPDDFFSSYDPDSRQVFIADDAFGRTEYDPTLGRKWEKDLSMIFHRLDRRHWLIWTTRKHILTRALKDMDLAGRAAKFPAPGELIVTAEDLSLEEKARILYRHAVAGKMETFFKEVVKNNAYQILTDKHFTPERIRRFIQERIPSLAKANARKPLTPDSLKAEIAEAIRSPTKRMQKAFGKLDPTHKWILISLLESPFYGLARTVKATYGRHRPELSEESFAEVLDDLVGTFIKSISVSADDFISWIHPSYRDLVIEELTRDLPTQSKFLRNTSLAGIKLALSEAGGRTGDRALPLMGSARSWRSVADRSLELFGDGDGHVQQELFTLFTNTLEIKILDESSRDHTITILGLLSEAACRGWALSDTISIESLKAFFRARAKLNPMPVVPDLTKTWDAASDRLRKMIEEESFLNQEVVAEWKDLKVLLMFHLPQFFADPRIRQNYKDDFAMLIAAINEEITGELDVYGRRAMTNQADRVTSLAQSLFDFEGDEVIGSPDLEPVISDLERIAEDFKERISTDDEIEDDDVIEDQDEEDEFDVGEFFADL